jgi:LysM repeat protein
MNMTIRARTCLLASALAISAASPASAGVSHTVQPGETLWTIAAANNFTTRSLAAANGLSETSNVILGSTITIPSVAEAALALAGSAPQSSAPAQTQGSGTTTGAGGGYTVRPGDTLSGIAVANGVSLSALAAANGLDPAQFLLWGTTIRIPSATASAAAPAQQPSSSAPQPLGGYTVRPGESLSGIAMAAGVQMDQVAWMNGLDPSKPLLIGTVLKLPTGASQPQGASAPVPAQTVVPQAAPEPTPGRVSSAQIAQIAAQHGVPGSLAAAIAWQESGFNNNMVSSANARGVMQIMPGTWEWVNQNLTAGNPLNPNSAIDNVRGGVLYLRQLLQDFGGDQNSAIAAYYQGAGAVRSRGLFPETQQYVANVNALRSRFGG